MGCGCCVVGYGWFGLGGDSRGEEEVCCFVTRNGSLLCFFFVVSSCSFTVIVYSPVVSWSLYFLCCAFMDSFCFLDDTHAYPFIKLIGYDLALRSVPTSTLRRNPTCTRAYVGHMRRP